MSIIHKFLAAKPSRKRPTGYLIYEFPSGKVHKYVPYYQSRHKAAKLLNSTVN
jgi:hypothetical protein